MAIVKHPKNRHVMAATAKSKPYVTRAVKPNRKAARVERSKTGVDAAPETPEAPPIPIDLEQAD